MKLLTKFKEYAVGTLGYNTKRHLVVIESDDWGCVRMPSRKVFNELLGIGERVDKDPFLRFDCLESEADLNSVFDILSKFKDIHGKSPVITANFAVANPKFDKINIKNQEYSFELFNTTYSKYYTQNVFSCLKNGIDSRLIYPQLHCREHLNVNRWMSELSNNQITRLACRHGMIGVYSNFNNENRFGYMDAFNDNWQGRINLSDVLSDAVIAFMDIFKFKPKTIVFPCFVWNSNFEIEVRKNGILGIQSAYWQNIPIGSTYRRKLHFFGQKNKFGTIFSIRNCSLEQALVGDVDKAVSECIKEIKQAFYFRKPAIIDMHRVNISGEIFECNRNKGCVALEKILTWLLKTYPDVEFVSSDELNSIISNE